MRPSEHFQDFVSHLLQLAHKILGDPDQSMSIIKELAFKNANKHYKEEQPLLNPLLIYRVGYRLLD